MTVYRYANEWNDQTLRPKRSEPYLEESEARERYENGGKSFDVIPEPDPSTGIPAWAMRIFTGDGAVKVTHYDARGTVTRITGFRRYEPGADAPVTGGGSGDARLFHDEIVDYFYPESDERQFEFQSSSSITAYIKPNGTSKVIYQDVEPGKQTTAEYRDVPVESYWADRPAFGEWAALADPNYGDSDIAAPTASAPA